MTSVMDRFEHFRKQIVFALEELVTWGEKKKEAEQHMAKLRQLIIANANMLPEEERGAFINEADESFVSGFTDNIRHLFRVHYPDPLTPTQVRDELLQAGVDLSGQSNAMASIHSVIRRLLEAEEIQRFGAGDLGAYRWNNDANQPLRELTRKPKSFGERIARGGALHAALRDATEHDKKK
jgi:hypothetical protein